MDQSAKISVIITLYNVEKYARDSIACIVNQTYKNLEILCINDGSTDGTLAIANEFAAQDPRITVITQPNSGCAAGAINTGLDHATGDDIYVMDGDDKISPDALEKMKARQLEADADMTICDKWHIYPDNPEKNWAWLGITDQVGKTNENPDRDIILRGRDAIPYTLVTWRMTGKGLYKRSLFDTIRYSTKGINGDEVTIREMFIKSKRIAFSRGEYYYLQHNQSITKKIGPRYFDMFQSDEDMHDLLVKHDFSKDIIVEWQKLRIKKQANYRRDYLNNKHNLTPDECARIEKILDDAYAEWVKNTKNCSLYLKLKYRYNYFKRLYKRRKKKVA